MNAPLTSASFPNGLPAMRSEAEARAERPLSMMDVIRAGVAKPVQNHPLTRKDEADMCALVNTVLCGGDITNIGGERTPKVVTADEVLVSDPYCTGYETEIV